MAAYRKQRTEAYALLPVTDPLRGSGFIMPVQLTYVIAPWVGILARP